MKYHMSLCVRGALKWPKARLKKMFLDDAGKSMTADQARNVLLDELSQGHEVIPMGKCDNFDFKTGCRGHEEDSRHGEA